jgi:hypothetical protein
MTNDFWSSVAFGLGGMLFIWAVVCYVGHGYCSTVLRINLALFRHINRVKARHHRKAQELTECIMREFESGLESEVASVPSPLPEKGWLPQAGVGQQ